jgi:MFS family permease
LFAINMMNFFDRNILGAVGELVRKEWDLSDTALGWLGTAFLVLYAAIGVPLGRMADRGNRSMILAGGVFVWSVLTALSGMAQNFFQMAGLRLAVGVGEATCAPASSSLIGDLFPATSRARALAVFMLGLPLGTAACYAVSGTVAQKFGWQAAFYIAMVPGFLCAIGAFFICEPARGSSEKHNIGTRKRDGSPYWLVLSTPTMRWIIASGALHNFNMYIIGGFLTIFMMRYHGRNIAQAGNTVMLVYGLAGIPGLFLGGFLGDRLIHTRKNGRMLVAAVALAISVPLLYFSLERPAGDVLGFSALFFAGCGMMYTYYSTVYSTVQDVIEPSLRGTAMALYFCAMYAFGGMFGPPVFGAVSDHFTARAAVQEGVSLEGLTGAERQKALEPFKPIGTHSAMYLLPLVNLGLAAVLFAGTRTVAADAERLQKWMRETTEQDEKQQLEKVGA